MLKPRSDSPCTHPCLITVQDNTMLKQYWSLVLQRAGLITVQDNTMLKHVDNGFLLAWCLITVQDNTMLKQKCLCRAGC